MKNGPERRAAELAEAGVDAVNLHHSDWSGGLTTLFHRFNRYCIAWDAQHVRLIKDLFRMGVDGVHSDHVDRLRVRSRAELRPTEIIEGPDPKYFTHQQFFLNRPKVPTVPTVLSIIPHNEHTPSAPQPLRSRYHCR